MTIENWVIYKIPMFFIYPKQLFLNCSTSTWVFHMKVSDIVSTQSNWFIDVTIIMYILCINTATGFTFHSFLRNAHGKLRYQNRTKDYQDNPESNIIWFSVIPVKCRCKLSNELRVLASIYPAIIPPVSESKISKIHVGWNCCLLGNYKLVSIQ